MLALKTSLLNAELAPATVKKILGLLRQSLGAAVTAGLIARNPAAALPNPSVVASSGERRALSEDELRKLLRAAVGTPYDIAIRFALATGSRQAEALGARWQDIDLERRTFLVQQTLAYVEHEFRMVPRKPVTVAGRSSCLRLPPPCCGSTARPRTSSGYA